MEVRRPAALVLVAGAGGFIGGHLVGRLRSLGHPVRAVDVKPFDDWFQRFPDVDERRLDLALAGACCEAVDGASVVYNLASDMGGMGFIERHKARCMLSSLINTHLLLAARDRGVERYFFASTACVYQAARQATTDVGPGLREEDVYPAAPEDGYGWEKLFGERMCRHFREDFGLRTRVARYHNVYGPHGTWDGGREKAPAAICRKVAAAKLGGTRDLEVWGDGSQTRSFTFIDDGVEGTCRLVASDVAEPLNVGSSETVTVDALVSLVEAIAGLRLRRRYKLDAPLGVRGRSSNNERIRSLLDWEPSTPLAAGLERTYRWIFDELAAGRPSKGATL